jgi:hypothetical protein
VNVSFTLALLCHGEARTFRRTVESFADRVTPEPERVAVFGDAVDAETLDGVVATVREAFPRMPLRVGSTHPDRQAGFCEATGRLWGIVTEKALTDIPEFVFWLEADFVFLRDVDLQPLADVLRAHRRLAQMSLVRDACNQQEALAGGLVASRPGEFEQRETAGNRWMEQRSYVTTTPSLMSAVFMVANPWLSDGQPACEGRFGIELVQRGYSFGAWGSGEEWVAHMGVRDKIGKGY